MQQKNLALAVALALAGLLSGPPAAAVDWRNIQNGSTIYGLNYADQPYLAVNPDGSWTCVLTTGDKPEGGDIQYIVALRSTDYGHTWSAPVDIEPAANPEASWATPLVPPSGRIYVFYTYNKDNIRAVNTYPLRPGVNLVPPYP